MNTPRQVESVLIAAALALACSAVRVQAVPNFTVAAFATGTQGENSAQDGSNGQYNGDCLTVPYGVGEIAWDGITFDAADGSTGSALITANFESANNTELLVSMAPGYNNWYFAGSSGSCPTGTVDFTQYHAVQFDILWNTNSQLTIDQFNTGNNWPPNLLAPGLGSNYMATNSYYTAGVNVLMFTGNNGANIYLGTFQVPDAASNGWQTVTMPYSDTIAQLGQGGGLWFQGSFGGGAGVAGGGPVSASFWIDNVVLVGNVTVSGPPTVSPPAPATPGLNIFNAQQGTGSFPFSDRNEVLAKTTSGLSWVSNTPASYSFNLAGFPNGVAYSGEAYMFLVPDAEFQDNAPDYNEAATMVLEIQTTPTGGQASLSYKVSQPQSETYSNVAFPTITGPSATTNTGAVPTSKVLGTYTLTFTGDDAGTVTTPDGTVGTFTLPAGTGTTYFAEGITEPVPTNAPTQTNNFNFLIYLGGQANDASFINKPTVYGSVTVTGPPNGALASENFVNDANSSLPLQNWGASWSGAATTTPSAVVLVPTNAPYWVDWTLPSSGYVLAQTPTLANADWLNVSTFSPISLTGFDAQLVSQNDLTSTNSEFFALVHRSFSQLLILLPGQTNTPGVAPGYAGTPTPVATGGTYGEEDITVLAVDSQWNPVGSGVSDIISITSSDGSAIRPTPTAMANGSVTFGASNPFFFATAGSQTIMATDTTSGSIPVATSAAVTVTNP